MLLYKHVCSMLFDRMYSTGLPYIHVIVRLYVIYNIKKLLSPSVCFVDITIFLFFWDFNVVYDKDNIGKYARLV